ncbi:MAG: sulfatase [Myxococcales bacterium]|nr:sulfatase [Myxococcales bacterium]
MSRGSETRHSPSLTAWSGAGLRAGLMVGAVAGAVALVAGAVGSHGARASTVCALVAAAASAAGVGLGAFLVAAVTHPLLGHRAGRVVAIALQAMLVAAFFGTHVTSSVLRALSGSYLTLGAIEFFLAGGPHLLSTIVVEYGRWVALLALAISAVAFGVVRHARQALASPRPGRLLRLATLAGVATAGLLPATLMPNLSLASPEAAFAESMSPEEPAVVEAPVHPTAGSPSEKPRPEPPNGAPLTEGRAWAEAAQRLPQRRTNVLLLTLESISIRHLGYMGYERPTTPNLDRIARRSVRARRAWSTATHSNYAQMAVLSSLFPRRTTGLDVYKRLDYPRVLLHDVFHTLGHQTATISSQDENWQGMIKFETTETPTFFRHSRNYTGTLQNIGSELVVLDHVTVDLAADWIQKRGERPWSLYVNFQATHFPYKLQAGIPTPFQPTALTPGSFNYLSYPESDRQAVINRYDNALRYVDEQIGKLEQALARAGKLDDTIWVITADHGEAFHDHHEVTHGKTLYDTEARVPLLIHWPNGLKPADLQEPVSHLDILPTLLDLLEVPPHPAFQGKSMLAADASPEPTGVYMNIQGLKSAEALVCFPWKLIVNRSDKTTELFQLEEDPGELHDRSARDALVTEALKTTLSSQIGAQLAYHRKDSPALAERFAPRLLTCPALPGVVRASAPTSPKPDDVAAGADPRPVRRPEPTERKN